MNELLRDVQQKWWWRVDDNDKTLNLNLELENVLKSFLEDVKSISLYMSFSLQEALSL